MVVLELGAHQQVADDARVLGNLDADGVIDCPHRGQSMGVRSNPAGALHEMLGIPGVAPLQDQLDPAEHLAGAPGIDNFAAGHLDLDPEMPFYSGNRINRYSVCHMISSLFPVKRMLFALP